MSFFLQKTMLLLVGSRPKGIDFLPGLGRNSSSIAGVRLQLLQARDHRGQPRAARRSDVVPQARRGFGLEMRAAAENFSMAQVLGVRANRVIATAFAISALLAGAVACLSYVADRLRAAAHGPAARRRSPLSAR